MRTEKPQSPGCKKISLLVLCGLLLLASLATAGDTSFSFETQGTKSVSIIGSDGGAYEMAGRFHISLIHSEAEGEMIVLDFASKTADALAPGEYSIGMFGQIHAGIEFRTEDRTTEFDATGGSLKIESEHDGILQGSFELQASDMDNGDEIEIRGHFEASPIDPSTG